MTDSFAKPLRGWLAVIVPAALLLLLAALRPLAVPDEGRYADISRWMLVSGDWLTPRLDGLPFFHKPPLTHWLQAASMAVLGVTPWAARVPGVLLATLMLAGVSLAGRRLADAALARRATWMLGASGGFLIGGSTSTTTSAWRPGSPAPSGASCSRSGTANARTRAGRAPALPPARWAC